MEVIKKSTNKNTKSVEGKTTRQIRLIHYNKIEITTLMLYPKPEFTINWENIIIPLGTNTTSLQKSVARSSTLNISILCDYSTQIIVLEKTPIYLSCVSWAKEKSHFLFSLSAAQNTILFPSVGFKSVFQLGIEVFDFLCNWYTYFYM